MTNGETPTANISPLSEDEERQWAMFAHLGILVNLISGFLGVFVPLVIYMLYKDRSRYVRLPISTGIHLSTYLVGWGRNSSWSCMGYYKFSNGCSGWASLHPICMYL